MGSPVVERTATDVSSGTQIHLTTKYSRNKNETKVKPKRVFNFVISGLLISASLVGAVLGNGNFAEAAANSTPVPVSTVASEQYTEEAVMVRNLNMATNALQLAISQGDIDVTFYDSVMRNLLLIDARINADGKFSELISLSNVLKNTEKALTEKINTTDSEVLQIRKEGINALDSVKDNILKERSVGFADIKDNTRTVAKLSVNPTATKASYSVSKVSTSYKAVNYSKASSYKDFKSDQYWSKGMEWVVSKGYINVYKNTSHPTTGKKGNWLNPAGGMTEGQMLYMLTKYKYGSEYSKTKASSGVTYSTAYKVSDKHKLPTKATHSSNRSYASKTVTRGQFAQILASAHYGKKVSEKEAVKFMYSAGISNGNKSSNGKYAKTYESFGVKTKVSRAYGVFMMANYKDFLAKPVPKPPVKPPTGTATPHSRLSVLYGAHDYGSNTQYEYDKVIEIAKKELEGVENGPYAQTPDAEKAYADYLDGAKPITDRSNPNFRTYYNMALLYATDSFSEYKNSGLSKDEIISYWRVQTVYSTVSTGTDPETGAPNSAYDALVLKTTDCDADAQVINLFLDMMGYNTAVLGRPGHAFPVVKLGGSWRNTATFRKVDINDYKMRVGGEYVISAPTKGY